MKALRIFLLFAFSLSVFPLRTYATLGEKLDSIERDRQAFSATLSLTKKKHKNFTVHEINQEGLIIHELTSKDGVVFGIAWEGNAQPDLRPLLGTHFMEYSEMLQTKKKRMGRTSHETIQSSTLVVEKFGHMRALGGRAFLPALLPKGVTANDIQ